MKSISGEQISALVDDELENAELELVLRRMAADEEVRGKWQRYHLANEALRNGLPKHVDVTLADRVRERLADEPDYMVPSITRSWSRPVVGMAVAASLLVVFVTSSLVLQEPSGGKEQFVAADTDTPATVASVQPATIEPESIRDRWEPQTSHRIYPYVVNHSKLATSGTFPAVLPYVRMIGYETTR